MEEPCYNTPISLINKEIVTKISNYAFGIQASDQKVDDLVAIVTGEFTENTYLQVLELGYTNNPKAIPTLVSLLGHEDTMIQACALSALGMLGAAEHFELMKNIYMESSDTVKMMALKAIGDLDIPDSKTFLESLKGSVDYENPMVKELLDLYL